MSSKFDDYDDKIPIHLPFPPSPPPSTTEIETTTIVSSTNSSDESNGTDFDPPTTKNDTIKKDYQINIGIPLVTQQDPDDQTASTSNPSTMDGSKTSAASRRASDRYLWWHQLTALLRKISLTKIRTPAMTIMEIFTPVAMMLVLVAAHNLSTVTDVKEGKYVSFDLDIPGVWGDVIGRSVRSFSEDLRMRLNERDGGGEVDVGSGGGGAVTFASMETPEEVNDNDDDDDDAWETMQQLRNMRGQLSSLLDGPIPTPSLSQYVGISNLISSSISNSTIAAMIDDYDFGRQWGNLITLGTLHLSPQSDPLVADFMEYLNSTQNLNNLSIRTHESESEGLAYIMSHLNERTWALIDFSSSGYKIRMNYTTLPNTARVTNFVSIGLNTRYQRYVLSGFLTLQRALTDFSFARENCTGYLPPLSRIMSAPMPTAAYSQNVFFTAVGYLLGMTMAMAFLFPMSRLVKSLVEEKETRMKQTLFIMGVKPWVYFASWVVSSVMLFLVIAILVTVTLSRNVLKHSSPQLLFLYIFLFTTATISFSFFISTFFSRAKLAAIVAPIALFVTLLPRWIFFGTNRYEATAGKKLASFAPCTAFAFGADILSDYEYAEMGVQSWNMNEGEYSFATCLRFLLFDSVFYLILAWYLDLVLPSQYGVRRHCLFFLSLDYWRSFFSKGGSTSDARRDFPSEMICSSVTSNPDDAETPPSHLRPQILISDLTKRYGSSSSEAVSHLTLTLYRDQITCLLGHNGAGKTTTISVLTGLYPATTGECLLYQHGRLEPLTRESGIGICPQHNILFPELTVTEHLRFFEKIRGNSAPSREYLHRRAQEVGLTEKLSAAAKSLSGGTKRKLCVAMALTGDPPLVVLDEPTSGMDPYSRRATWELLRRRRGGKVTLLTTHFMDEAEILADRIAVLKGGRLKCVGGGLFLKNRFGLGYNLRVVTRTPPGERVSEGTVSGIRSFLERYAKGGVECVRHSGREVTFRFAPGQREVFPALFDAFESSPEMERLGVTGYGVSNTSLGDVFIQLSEEEEEEQEMVALPVAQRSAEVTEWHQSTPASFGEQVRLLLLKRLLIQKRDGKGFVFSIVLPVVVIALVLLVLVLDVPLAGPPLSLGLNLYEKGGTDVVLGGGPERWEVPASLRGDHSGVSFTETNYSTSARLSDELLDSYNNHSHAARYGAFVFDDKIDVTVRMDWDAVRSMVQRMGEALLLVGHSMEPLNLTDWGIGGDGGGLNVTVGMIADWFYGVSGLRPQDGIDEDTITTYIDSLFATIQNRTDALVTSAFAQDLIWSEYLLVEYAQGVVSDLSSAASPDEAKAVIANVTEAIDGFLQEYGNKTMIVEYLRENGNLEVINAIIEQLRNASLPDMTPIVSGAAALWGNASNVTLGMMNVTSRMMNVTNDLNLDNLVVYLDELQQGLECIIGTSENIDTGCVMIDNLFDLLFLNGTSILADYLNEQIDVSFPAFREMVNVTSQLLDWYAKRGGVGSLLWEWDSQMDVWQDELHSKITAFVNDVFAMLTDDDTLSISDLFESASVLLGGDGQTLSGGISIGFSSFVVIWAEGSVKITNLTIATTNNATYEIGNVSFSYPVSLYESVWNFLMGFIPRGSETINITYPTDTTILHNSSSSHAIAAMQQTLSQIKYKQCTTTASDYNNATAPFLSSSVDNFEIINHPLPLTAQEAVEIRIILSIIASLFILIPYCYIPAAFTVFLVRERVSKSKHLQLVSGVNMSAYWLSTYLWDVLQFTILSCAIMLIFFIYGRESAQVFVGDAESALCTFLLTLGYGMSALPMGYLLSRHFENHSNAQISICGIFCITGFVAVNAYWIMMSIETTKYVAEVLRPLFRLWPAYNVGDGFLQMSMSFSMRMVGQEEGVSPFDWEVCGKDIALLFGLVIPYSTLLLLLEYSSDGGSGGIVGRALRGVFDLWDKTLLRWHGVTKTAEGELALNDGLDAVETEDDDVAEERLAVNDATRGLKEKASVFIGELWKVYAPSVGIVSSFWRFFKKLVCCCRRVNREEDKSALPKRAVRGLSTAIMPGETFGLLGVNGAGKTTTLSILTGDIRPTSGEAYVAGKDVTGRTPGGVAEARKSIGFCPQVDPLLDLMTGRDTLLMFGRLRGIPAEHLHQTVDDLIDSLTLTPHANKKASSYSGGNKRKLSLGVAIIGNPDVLFIDEASSGMDPVARRKMWDIISTISQRRSVILTTHSMEEAEALCTRVAIMTSGRARCLGSVQHLKRKFLDGYTLDVQCRNEVGSDVVDRVERFILTEAFVKEKRRVVLSERHGVFLRFDVENHCRDDGGGGGGIGEIFRRMEEMKSDDETFALEDYSISQCTLEQVFLSLAKEEEDS